MVYNLINYYKKSGNQERLQIKKEENPRDDDSHEKDVYDCRLTTFLFKN